MQKHFNKLTPAQAERLAMLSEECGEVVQMVGKILRHGYENYHPDDSFRTSNRTLLTKELVDVFSIFDKMVELEDIKYKDIDKFKADDTGSNWRHKLRYTHYQEHPND